MRLRERLAEAQAAFTLIELLVAVAVMGVLTSGLISFLGNFLNMKFNAEAHQRMREEGTYALDRIEYLVRNGITLPDICKDLASYGSNISDSGRKTEVKFNLRDFDDPARHMHRMQVKYFETDGEIIEFTDYPSDKTHATFDNSRKENGVNLTKMNPGSTGKASSRFNVSKFDIRCVRDNVFLDGYYVHVEFDITYGRRTLDGRESRMNLTEHFARDIAVRNTDPFQP